MQNKAILVVSQVFPFPLYDGGRVDVFFRLKALKALGYRVYLIAYYNPRFSIGAIEQLESLCEAVFPIPYLRRNLKKMLGLMPYNIANKNNVSGLTSIREDLEKREEQFSFVLAESHHVLHVADWFRQAFSIPKLILRSHNNEPRFMHSVAVSAPLLSLTKPFFYLEALKYRLFEKKVMNTLQKDDAVWHISHDEWERDKTRFKGVKQYFLPAGVEMADLRPFKEKKDKKVLFIGALFSPNNLQGLQWYLKHVHRRVLQLCPDYRFIVAGNTKGADRTLLTKLLNCPGVSFYDTPDDLSPLYTEASLFINPMLSGAGVKLKTVQALLNGMPIVSTAVGNEGTGLQNREHLIVAEKADECASCIASLLNDLALQRRLVTKGQEFLKAHYHQKEAIRALI